MGTGGGGLWQGAPDPGLTAPDVASEAQVLPCQSFGR